VDSNYWKDVRDNLILDGDGPRIKSIGHSTCIMKDLKYKCIDSIPQKGKETAMIYTW